jgi:hypothetical protein
MRIIDMQIGQGYLLIETNNKVGPKDLAQRISERSTVGLNPTDISRKYNENIKDKEDGLTLREKIKQDSLPNIFIKIQLVGQAYLIPGLKNKPSTKHKLYLIDDNGVNQFNNPKWDVLSTMAEEELPRMLELIYNNFKN